MMGIAKWLAARDREFEGFPVGSTEAKRPEWMDDRDRRPWVVNSLKTRLAEMRSAERRCRDAFNKEWMNQPANWLADCYRDAAKVLEDRLAIIEKCSEGQKGGAA